MLHEISFLSSNQRDQVQGWIYVPAAKPKGIVQLIHGFGEHSRRYFHMIVGFLSAGYVVAANDHVGHGKTAIVNNSWGDWGENGCRTMMEDEHIMKELVCTKLPKLPYFLFGHSMGSLIARDFIDQYGHELAGVTLCGTLGSDSVPIAAVLPKIRAFVDSGHGREPAPELLNALLGGLFGRCEEGVHIGNEWICHDPYVQKDHAEDPFDAFTKPLTSRALQYFAEMIELVCCPEWARKVPASLPVYNIGGDQDPVGSFGKGIYECSNWLSDNGNMVRTKVYSGYRHEIHNYADIQNDVVQGIVNFMNEVLQKR